MTHTEQILNTDLTQALCSLATAAEAAYPAEASRMRRGLALALEGGVDLHADKSFTVFSGEHRYELPPYPEKCPCEDARFSAPEGRCKHRWAASLYRKALATVVARKALFEAPSSHERLAQDTSLAAMVCNPEWRAQRALAGHETTAGR